MQSESYLINKYFKRNSQFTKLSIGDDAAVLDIENSLVVSTDTMVNGIHFAENDDPFGVGYKSLGTALSDLAAMGAKARWALLCLTLPDVDEQWIKSFSNGFFTLAEKYNIELIGGDMTRGKELVINVQVMGETIHYMTRSNAQHGQGIYVTGCLAMSALAGMYAEKIKDNTDLLSRCMMRYHQPEPRLQQGLVIANYTNCATDISDGVLLDLSHILTASNVGAIVELDKLPLPKGFDKYCPDIENILKAIAYGEDYELIFTMNDDKYNALCNDLNDCRVDITKIGVIDNQKELHCLYNNKEISLPNQLGYDHFTK